MTDKHVAETITMKKSNKKVSGDVIQIHIREYKLNKFGPCHVCLFLPEAYQNWFAYSLLFIFNSLNNILQFSIFNLNLSPE